MKPETGIATVHNACLVMPETGVPAFILQLVFGGLCREYSYIVYRPNELVDAFLKITGAKSLETTSGLKVYYETGSCNMIRKIGNADDEWIDLYEFLN